MHFECGITHLDIKLENIVLDSSFCIKLIDFAFCEGLDTPIENIKGTEGYFAPEVHLVNESTHSNKF